MDEQIRQPATPLDRFDRAILDLLQEDSSQPHRAIAEQVHLSTSSVRRRIEAMKADGTILREVALVDPARYGLAFLTFVSFGEESPAAYDAFREQMRADAAVSQCHSVSGDHDFVLMVHAVSPAAYEQWGEGALMANPAIRRYSTSVVWSSPKFTTRITPAGE